MPSYVWFLKSKPHLTTQHLRSHLQRSQFSGDAINCCLWHTKCRRCRTGWILFPSRLNDSQNLQFGSQVLLICLTEVVGRVYSASLCQVVQLYLLLPKTLHAMLYCFGDCGHHPAGFIIFTKLAQLRIFFIIILVFHIIPIVGTWKITQTIADGVQYLLKCYFRLGGCQSRVFNISHCFLHLLNCCLCFFNLISCHSGLSVRIILDPFLLLFIG